VYSAKYTQFQWPPNTKTHAIGRQLSGHLVFTEPHCTMIKVIFQHCRT